MRVMPCSLSLETLRPYGASVIIDCSRKSNQIKFYWDNNVGVQDPRRQCTGAVRRVSALLNDGLMSLGIQAQRGQHTPLVILALRLKPSQCL